MSDGYRDRKLDETIQALTKSFNELNASLKEYFSEVTDGLGAVKQLPSMMEDVQETVTNQFTNLFEHGMKTEFASRKANIDAATEKARRLETFMERRQERLEEDTERVRRRYTELLEDLAEECEKRIRDLDSHAFRIVETTYPSEVQDRFSRLSVPAVRRLAEEADRAAEARNAELLRRWTEARRAVEDYLEGRRRWAEELRGRLTGAGVYGDGTGEEEPAGGPVPRRSASGAADGKLRISVLVVETEEWGSGETGLELAVAGGGEIWPLDALPGAVAARIREAVESEIEDVGREAADPEAMEEIARAVADRGLSREHWWPLAKDPPAWLAPPTDAG